MLCVWGHAHTCVCVCVWMDQCPHVCMPLPTVNMQVQLIDSQMAWTPSHFLSRTYIFYIVAYDTRSDINGAIRSPYVLYYKDAVDIRFRDIKLQVAMLTLPKVDKCLLLNLA